MTTSPKRTTKKAIKMINSREKGARGERLFAEALREFGEEARRGQQFQGSPESPDVVHSIPWIHFECKFTERLNLREAYEQAVRDAPSTRLPIVAHKKKREPWLVTLSLEDFMKLRLRLAYLIGDKKINEHV